jgi:hypothetical protein
MGDEMHITDPKSCLTPAPADSDFTGCEPEPGGSGHGAVGDVHVLRPPSAG